MDTAPPNAAATPPTAEELKKLTVPQLKKLCDELGIDRKGKRNEPDLIDLIVAHYASAPAAPAEPVAPEPAAGEPTGETPGEPAASELDGVQGETSNQTPATQGADSPVESGAGEAPAEPAAGEPEVLDLDAINPVAALTEPWTDQAEAAMSDVEAAIERVMNEGIDPADLPALHQQLLVFVPCPVEPDGLRQRMGSYKLTAEQAATQNGLFLKMQAMGLPVRRQSDVYGALLDLVGNAYATAE